MGVGVNMNITEAEQKILNLLWEEGSLSTMQITERLEGETGWSKHAVISFLKRMETVVIASDSIMEDVYDGKRCLYLLFNRRWAEEDLNDNGVGIRLLGEEIDETSFKDIAF